MNKKITSKDYIELTKKYEKTVFDIEKYWNNPTLIPIYNKLEPHLVEGGYSKEEQDIIYKFYSMQPLITAKVMFEEAKIKAIEYTIAEQSPSLSDDKKVEWAQKLIENIKELRHAYNKLAALTNVQHNLKEIFNTSEKAILHCKKTLEMHEEIMEKAEEETFKEYSKKHDKKMH